MCARPPRIVSTDVGIDDALALIMLHALPGTSVDYVLATGGNVPVEAVAANCAYLKQVFDWPTPLFRGTDPPAPAQVRDAAHVHGPRGLGTLSPPPAELPDMAALSDLLRRRPEELDLLVLGPATDAAALLRDPHLGPRVESILLMGGAFQPRGGRLGNTTRWAEFNIHMDPRAAMAVIESGRPCRFVPLDATERRLFTAAELLPAAAGGPHRDLIQDLVEHLQTAHLRLGEGEGVYMHDVIAAAVRAGRVEAQWATTAIADIPEAGERRGMMVPDGPGAHPVRYAESFDEEAFLATWHETVAAL